MVKIFIYIFSFLAITNVYSESITKKELSLLKQKCVELYNNKKYSESIPILEKYLSFRNEIKFKILLAKAVLFRKDLQEPKEDDDIFSRGEKNLFIINNYKKSSKIFSEVVPYLEKVTPKDKSISDLYFLWAISENYSENKEKAIALFKLSSTKNREFKEISNYNIATLYEDLGQISISQIYFNK